MLGNGVDIQDPGSKAVDESSTPVIGETNACVEDYYSADGFWQSLARSSGFKIAMNCFTVAFLVWLAVDTDFNAAAYVFEANIVFIIAFWLFFLAFVVDVTVRTLAFRRKSDIRRDQLLILEIVLTLFFFVAIVVPADFAKVFLVAQLGRYCRLANAVPEMGILGKGLFCAMRSIFFCWMMLTSLIYMFSIAFVNFSRDTHVHDVFFPNVLDAMWSLLLHLALFQDLGEFLTALQEESGALAALAFIALLLIGSMIFITIGVLCEVVSVVAKQEKDTLVQKYLVDTSSQIAARVCGSDSTIHQGMSRGQIDMLVNDNEFMQFLGPLVCHLGTTIDLADLKGLVDIQFALKGDLNGDKRMSHNELMGLVVELTKPEKSAVKNMLRLRQVMLKKAEGGVCTGSSKE